MREQEGIHTRFYDRPSLGEWLTHLVLRGPGNLIEKRLMQRSGYLLRHSHEPLAQYEADAGS